MQMCLCLLAADAHMGQVTNCNFIIMNEEKSYVTVLLQKCRKITFGNLYSMSGSGLVSLVVTKSHVCYQLGDDG